jgi:hypothetical protein
VNSFDSAYRPSGELLEIFVRTLNACSSAPRDGPRLFRSQTISISLADPLWIYGFNSMPNTLTLALAGKLTLLTVLLLFRLNVYTYNSNGRLSVVPLEVLR